MKGLIDVRCTIGRDYNTGDLYVTTTCKIENKESKYHTKKNLSSIVLKSKYEIRFDMLQVLAANHNMIDRLEDKGGIVFPDCPADFIYQENEDGSHYYLVLVDLGTKDMPYLRSFYLSKSNELYLKAFNPVYQFTKTDKQIKDSDE